MTALRAGVPQNSVNIRVRTADGRWLWYNCLSLSLIHICAVQVDITGGKITDCTALENASGGGIYLYVNSSSARINLSGVTISGCKAAYGGGAFLAVENAEIGDDTVFTGNTARNSGGGLCLMSRKGIQMCIRDRSGSN